jgi:hypothetical protein
VYGFSKSQRGNISEKEEREFKEDAKKAFAYPDEALVAAIKTGLFIGI